MGLRLERAALLAPPFAEAGFDAERLEDLSPGLSAGFSVGLADSFADEASAFVSAGLASLASLASLPSLLPSLPFSSLALVSVSFAASFGASSGRSAKLRWLSLSPLKSVSYQPPPLSLKTGADISRVSCDF